MSADLLIVIPSRERPDAIRDLMRAWGETTTGAAELLVCLDGDDPTIDAYPDPGPWSSVVVGPRNGFAPRLNEEAMRLADQYLAIGSWGDDHRPRTIGWDSRLVAELHRTAVVYGDDRLMGEALPTACHLRSDVVQALGYLTPPGFQHLFVDNVWLELGLALDSLQYLPEVVIEHMHPNAGKADWDAIYGEGNSNANVEGDRARFKAWKRELPELVERIKEASCVRS